MAQRAIELGRFLRSRRDRVRPHEVGLPSGARRKVPGLRREEVAVLANVGASWYAWLEQGRDVRPSAAVLAALADALLLTPDERATLYTLGGSAADPRPPQARAHLDDRMIDVLEDLAPSPAVVHDHMYRILAYNETYRFLINDLDAIPPERRNCVLLSFTDADWTEGIDDIVRIRAFMVGKLRSAYSATLDDARWEPLLASLHAASPEFSELWATGDVHREFREVKDISSRHVGSLRLRPLSMIVQENQRLRLMIEQPADALTRRRLDELRRRVGAGEIDGPSGPRVVADGMAGPA